MAAEVLGVALGLFELDLLAGQLGPLGEGDAQRLVDVDRDLLAGLGVGGRHDRRLPERAGRQVEELPERVLGVADGGGRPDDPLLTGGDGRLALRQLERRQGADLHLDLVALVQVAGELQALLGDHELLAGVDQGPVGVDHPLGDRGHLEREVLPAELAVDLRHDNAPLVGVAAVVAQERLGEGEVQPRGVERGDVLEAAGALGTVGVHADRDDSALRRALLEVEVEHLILGLRGLRLVGHRLVLIPGRGVDDRVEVVQAQGLDDGEALLDPGVALDDDAEVALQRDLDRPVDRKLDGVVPDVEGRGLRRRWRLENGADADLRAAGRRSGHQQQPGEQEGPVPVPGLGSQRSSLHRIDP